MSRIVLTEELQAEYARLFSSCNTVSYTHLDVYKRQLYALSDTRLERPLSSLDGLPIHCLGAYSCLLYTSIIG